MAKRFNLERFYDEQYKVRRDFEKLLHTEDQKEIEFMLEKYELFIERSFEPYAAMHESRPHSNLNGKDVLYNDEALQSDVIGYYKPVALHGTPSTVAFHEQYPHLVTAWVYDHQYLSEEFNYEDAERSYINTQKSQKNQDPELLKQ